LAGYFALFGEKLGRDYHQYKKRDERMSSEKKKKTNINNNNNLFTLVRSSEVRHTEI